MSRCGLIVLITFKYYRAPVLPAVLEERPSGRLFVFSPRVSLEKTYVTSWNLF